MFVFYNLPAMVILNHLNTMQDIFKMIKMVYTGREVDRNLWLYNDFQDMFTVYVYRDSGYQMGFHLRHNIL